MVYLYVLQQALVWIVTIFWLYQFIVSICSLVKLKDKPLKIKKDHYVIRGDNTYSEEFIPKDKVFGILTSYYKNDKLKKVNTKGAILLYYLWLTTYPLRWLLVKTKRLLRRIIKGK